MPLWKISILLLLSEENINEIIRILLLLGLNWVWVKVLILMDFSQQHTLTGSLNWGQSSVTCSNSSSLRFSKVVAMVSSSASPLPMVPDLLLGWFCWDSSTAAARQRRTKLRIFSHATSSLKECWMRSSESNLHHETKSKTCFVKHISFSSLLKFIRFIYCHLCCCFDNIFENNEGVILAEIPPAILLSRCYRDPISQRPGTIPTIMIIIDLGDPL